MIAGCQNKSWSPGERQILSDGYSCCFPLKTPDQIVQSCQRRGVRLRGEPAIDWRADTSSFLISVLRFELNLYLGWKTQFPDTKVGAGAGKW